MKNDDFSPAMHSVKEYVDLIIQTSLKEQNTALVNGDTYETRYWRGVNDASSWILNKIDQRAVSKPNEVIKVYTDGACKGNPGKGGWAAIIVNGEEETIISGSCRHTTNNRMELQAVIRGLKHIRKPSNVEVYTDSAYVVNCFEKNWRNNWENKNWLTSKKTEVKNSDLWKELFSLVDNHTDVKFIKVKGHSGHSHNDRVDKIASIRASNA